MVVIEITADEVRHKSNTWHKGDEPTVSTRLAVQLIHQGKAIFIEYGCGCNRKKNIKQ